MTDSHHHRRAVLLALVATCTLIAHRTSIAQAQNIVNMSAIEQNGPLPRATTCTGSVYNLIVYRDGGRFVVPVNSKIETTVKVPSGLTEAPMPVVDASKFKVSHVDNRLYIHPLSTTSAGTETTARIVSPRFQGTLIFRTTDNAADAPDLVNMWHVSEIEAYKREVAALASKMAERQAQDQVMAQMLEDTTPLQGRPVFFEKASIHIKVEGHRRLGKHSYLPFSITNDDIDTTVGFASVKAYNRQQVAIPGAQVYIRPIENAPRPPDGTLVEIPAGTTVRGILHLPHTKQLVGPIDVEFTRTSGASMTATVNYMDGLRREAKTAEEWRAIDLRHDLYRQTSLSVRLLTGAMWFTDGTSADMVSPASVTGLAVRVQKGYESGWALEAEVTGIRTGDARFRGVSWNSMQGDVIRGATLGRVMGGGAVRFGYDYVFSGRFGVGMQAVNHSSDFEPANGTRTDGPDRGFAFDMVGMVGAGLDARIGKNSMLGAFVEGDAVLKNIGGAGISGSLETGLRFRYGWNP